MRLSARTAIWFALVSLGILIAAIGFLAVRHTADLHSTRRDVDHVYRAIDSLQDILQSVVDAEVGQRDYLLTGRKIALQPYHAAAQELPRQLRSAERQLADDGDIAARFRAVEQTVRGEFGELHRVLAAEDEGGLPAAVETARAGAGESRLGEIQREISGLIDDEETKLSARQTLASQAEQAALNYVAVVSVAALLCFALAVWALISDIRRRRQDAETLARLKAEAEAANASKASFIAMLSHELRSPLTSVIGFADLLVNQSFGPLGSDRYVDYASRIRRGGGHLLDLVNDILDLSRVEAGRLSLHEEAIPLAQVLGDCVDALSPQAEQAGITLRWSVGPHAEAVIGDTLRLRQAMTNLVSNAIKYTPFGGRIDVEARRDDESGELVLAVNDTGIGIAEEDIPRVLEPFTQIDNRGNREHRGTGLGLPLTKRLVEMHGGRLEVKSRLGSGTSMIIRLPPDRLPTAA